MLKLRLHSSLQKERYSNLYSNIKIGGAAFAVGNRMKIAFHKVSRRPIDIEHTLNGCTLKGELKRVSPHEVELDANLSGVAHLYCDRCGNGIERDIDTKLQLRLSDRAVGMDDLDTIEFSDGFIDFDYLIESEINLLSAGYNYCENCKNSSDELDIEY